METGRIVCNSPVEAEGFRSVLMEAGIESVTYDETNSKVARGILDTTTEVFVKAEDGERATQIYRTYLEEHRSARPWCPRCGSENVTEQNDARPSARRLPRFLLALITFVQCGFSAGRKFVCGDCGHRWER